MLQVLLAYSLFLDLPPFFLYYLSMNFAQLSSALSSASLTDEQIDEYMQVVLHAYSLDDGFGHLKSLFHNLAPNHEIQFLTDGEQSYPVGEGQEDSVKVTEDDIKIMITQALSEFPTAKPVYLVHNHPPLSDAYDTLPSPSDIAFFKQIKQITNGRVIGAVYTDSTDTLTAFPT